MVLSAARTRSFRLIPALVNSLVVPPLIALLISTGVLAILMRSRAAMLALDHPNERSLHTTPRPRLGGVGILAGTAIAWGYATPSLHPLMLLALTLLISVSLLDDLRGVSVVWRLLIHVAAALLAVSALLHGREWWQIGIAALATAWMINLYNFMDGSDGLAGGMAVIGFGDYGVAALIGGDISFAALNLAVATASLGFLLFNFPPSRIFMGDGGAIPLGFLAAVFNVTGWTRGDWPLWFGIAIFSPFIVDASLTLIKRVLRGARPWQAHREHYYQRLVRGGWSHRRTAYAEYAVMLTCGVVSICAINRTPLAQASLAGVLALLYLILIIAIERRFALHAQA